MKNECITPPHKNILSHHGVVGQEWGKKNGPPYPLKPSDHSVSEKKAGWRKSLESKKEAIDERTVGGLRNIIAKNTSAQTEQLAEYGANYLKDSVINKLEAREVKKEYAKEYKKGKSLVNKILTKGLGIDKTYANLRYWSEN